MVEPMSVPNHMKRRRIRKMPGISSFERNNQIHTFLAGDRSHSQSKKIYEELDVLVGKMKELGYVPEIDSVLHDVKEEDKECHLTVHSEKLAIVFAILNTQPGSLIRITKNLRVCGDCHIAAKFISRIVGGEISPCCIGFHKFDSKRRICKKMVMTNLSEVPSEF